jgi:pyruvate-ferredoxin/flavodoxin oxidoreductase
LFERTRVVVDGSVKHACHLIAGALDRVTITPELKSKIAHVAANCVAEIIHEYSAAPAAAKANGSVVSLAEEDVGKIIHERSAAPAPAKVNGAPVSLAEEDVAKCTNCKTCYHELPELFERTRVVVDGSVKQACHLIVGALTRVPITPELKSKIARIAANCVAEIIHEH